MNLNLLTKAIDLHVLLRQVHKVRLNLHPHDPLSQVAISQNQRDHPTAGPQIQDAIIGVALW